MSKSKTTIASRKASELPTKFVDMVPYGDRVRLRVGKGGAKLLYFGIASGVRIAAALVIYLVCAYMTTLLVPNLTTMVGTGSGVGIDQGLEAFFVFWVAPTLFMLALMFALVYAGIRAVWRVSTRFLNKVKFGLFRIDREDEEKALADSELKRKVTTK